MLTRSSFGTLSELARLTLDRRTGARGDIAAGFVVEICVLCLSIAGPLLLARAVDALTRPDEGSLHAVRLVVAFVASWALLSVFGSWKLVFTGRIASKVAQVLSVDALASIARRHAFESGFDGGAAQGMLERLKYSLDLLIEGLLWRFMPLLVQASAVVFLLFGVLSPLYAAIVGCVFLAFFALSQVTAARYEADTVRVNVSDGAISNGLGDYLRNLRKVSANGAVAVETERLSRIYGVRTQRVSEHAALLTRLVVLKYGLLGAGIAGLLALAARDVAAGTISLGDFVLIQAYVFQFAIPLASFGFVLRQSQICIANVADVLALARTGRARPRRDPMPALVDEIALRDVGFSYGAETTVLADCDLTIRKGSLVAIVGPNGAGKSTLAKLVAGVIQPTRGDVAYDGRSTATLDFHGAHRPVLYVPQHTTLLNRTVRDNLLFPMQKRSDAELLADLARLRFEEDVADEGLLDRPVGELGAALSGGQVQKLEIARLCGVRGAVLVLDETTSALDALSEETALDMLRASTDRAMVIVSHRCLPAERADLVIFVVDGTVRATGTHAGLTETHPAYRAHWSASAAALPSASAWAPASTESP